MNQLRSSTLTPASGIATAGGSVAAAGATRAESSSGGSSARISAVCSPRRGAGRGARGGVRVARAKGPGRRIARSSAGCGTSRQKSRASNCALAIVSAAVSTGNSENPYVIAAAYNSALVYFAKTAAVAAVTADQSAGGSCHGTIASQSRASRSAPAPSSRSQAKKPAARVVEYGPTACSQTT